MKLYCPTCLDEMKPLFTSWFCPNDCDKKPRTKVPFEKINPPKFAPSKGMIYVKASEIDWSTGFYRPYVPLQISEALLDPMDAPAGSVFDFGPDWKKVRGRKGRK